MNTTFEMIDTSIRSVDWNGFQANTFVPQTLAERVKGAAKMYRALRPLFAVVSTIPLIPLEWRTGITVFMTALDALAEETGATPDFKAGKDL
jgi:hypothetical protein